MVADSYNGEVVVGRCPRGHLKEIAADRELFGPTGHCPDCRKNGDPSLVEWTVEFEGDPSVTPA